MSESGKKKPKSTSGFHTPFADLADELRGRLPSAPAGRDKHAAAAAPRAQSSAPRAAPSAPPAAATPPPAGNAPDEEFLAQMAGVRPLAPDPRGRLGAPAPTVPKVSPADRSRDDAEAMAVLSDLIHGDGLFDIADTDEYIEGLAPGIDRRLLRRLRRGEYAVQGHVDLHGLRKDEAHLAVDRFLEKARAEGKRCVLIVHGRGLNSKDQIPVLKERLRVWLTRGRIARGVLAFSTARPADGGAGAVYVLLRR